MQVLLGTGLNEGQLARFGQLLDGVLGLEGIAPRWKLAMPEDSNGRAGAGVSRPLAGLVLLKAFGDVERNAGVERPALALKQIQGVGPGRMGLRFGERLILHARYRLAQQPVLNK